MQADIVGFQEVFSPVALKTLVRDHGFEHFAIADKPRKDSHHIYNKPVVALASKYPILRCDTIKLTKTNKRKSGLLPGFRFSRVPLKVEIFIENFGPCLVYVVHLKSNRSAIQTPVFVKGESWDKIAGLSMLGQGQGSWAALKQRGDEAMLLYQDMVREVMRNERPVMLLGDLNTSIHSESLQLISAARNIEKLKGITRRNLPREAQRQARRFALYDGFNLQDEVGAEQRKSTHYFGNKGNVLDYILLSKDFDHSYDRSLASVVNYQVYDRHLQNPEPHIDSQCSDHAPVVATLEIRK